MIPLDRITFNPQVVGGNSMQEHCLSWMRRGPESACCHR